MKTCFQFCAKSHRGVRRGGYISPVEQGSCGTQQSEHSSDNIDYVLVKKHNFERAVNALRGAGYEVSNTN